MGKEASRDIQVVVFTPADRQSTYHIFIFLHCNLMAKRFLILFLLFAYVTNMQKIKIVFGGLKSVHRCKPTT